MYRLRFGTVCHSSYWEKKIFTLTHLENSDELERFCKLDRMVLSTFGLLLEYLKCSLKTASQWAVCQVENCTADSSKYDRAK